MTQRQNDPLLLCGGYVPLARLIAADHKIAVTAVHQMFGFFNSSPDKTADPAAVVPVSFDCIEAKKVYGYLAMALSGQHAVKDAKQLVIIRLV